MDERRRRFETAVLPHLDAAWRFARWLARVPADADDVVQDAMLRAYRGFDALRGEDVKPWLLAIVRNCHFTAHSQARRRGFVPLPEEHDSRDGDAMVATGSDPERSAIEDDERQAFGRLLQSLPEEQREVLVLREIEEMNYREIAAIVAVPIGTVMSRLARARAALRARWTGEALRDADALR